MEAKAGNNQPIKVGNGTQVIPLKSITPFTTLQGKLSNLHSTLGEQAFTRKTSKAHPKIAGMYFETSREASIDSLSDTTSAKRGSEPTTPKTKNQRRLVKQAVSLLKELRGPESD